MGLAHEKKSYLQEKANLFEIGSDVFFITEPPCGLGNRNILLRTSWLHFFHPFKSLLGQV